MQTFSLATLPAEGTLVLCATQRLAQSLRASWDAVQLAAGASRWSTLDARTVGQWIDALGEELLLRGEADDMGAVRPLDAFQERLLWERIIAESVDDAAGALFDTAAMAASAAEAHVLATLWNVPVRGAFPSEENLRFQAWQQAFLDDCRSRRLIDTARRQKAVVTALATATGCLPQCVVFAGFDRYSPLEQQLQQILIGRGVSSGVLDFASRPAAAVRAVACADRRAECLAAALWARDQSADNPAARLGIVVPDLAGSRDLLQDTLDDVLAPAAIRAAAAESPRPFNISLGKPLLRYPLVGTALELLRLLCNARPVEQGVVSQLLRSPLWSAGVSEADDRARLDAALRDGVAPKATLERIGRFLRFHAERAGLNVARLLADVDALLAARGTLNKRRRPSAWAGALAAALNAAGWLAERRLSSHEYQTRQAFLEEMRKLAGLDALLGEIDAATALRHLTQLCGERVFQPQTEGKPALQVLGFLEAAGMEFDALWVMGMTDNAWPPPVRPNPLLSAEAQRSAETPNASAAVQLAFADAIQHRLCHSASQVVFSWPHSEGATALRPSPLLGELIALAREEIPVSPHWAVHAALARGAALAPPLQDSTAPPVGEGEKVKGGTWLLRAQAVCPAWAYFQYRLGAEKLPEPVEGLDAAKRGSLVHDALEAFWNVTGDSATLGAMDEAQRQQAVTAAVDQVLAAHDADLRQEPLKPRFRTLERQRTVRLLLRWLQQELERPLPFTVIANERRVAVDIEGIAVSMQIDRIDQLDDGRLLVIDYKTGAKIDTANWATDRITEPQLPIYAAIATPEEGPVAAVVFAKVILEGAAFAGIGAEDGLIPRVAALDSKEGRKLFADAGRFPDWAAVLDHWRVSIDAIAREVRAGEAAVRVADESALRYCEVLPLLRLAERRTQLEGAAS